MTGVLFRLALASSWRGRRGDVQRAALVALAALVGTVLVCGVISTSLMVQRVTNRSTARAFAPATSDAPALSSHTISDVAPDGQQIYVYWWRIEDPKVQIPGVPGAPEENSWYVSPALHDYISEDPTLADRFPRAAEIGRDGVGNAAELVAYRFVGPSVQLTETLSGDVDADQWLGETADLEALSVVRSAAILLFVPVVALLLAAMAPVAAMLEQRRAVLGAIGASRSVRSTLIFLQAAISALPGAVAGGLAWFLVAPRLMTVPFVGRRVLTGDLSAPLGFVAVAVLGVVVASGVVATVRPRSSAASRVTESVPAPPSASRLVPLVLGFVMMLAGSGAFGARSDQWFVAGLVASSTGAVIALPLLFARAGESLARSKALLPMLVGRRLSWNATVAARSMLALGAITAVTPVLASWIELQHANISDSAVRNESAPAGVSSVLPPDELRLLVERTGAVPLEVVSDPTLTPTDTASVPETLVGDCRRLAGLLAMQRCDASGFTLTSAAAESLARPEPPVEGLPARPDGFKVTETLLVSDDQPATDAALRTYINNREQPGIFALSFDSGGAVSPAIRWALGGLAITALASGAGLALQVIGQAARLGPSRIRMRYVGADIDTVRRLAGVESVVTIALAGLAGTVVGAVASWFFVQINPGAELPYPVAVAVAMTVVVVALAGGAASWVSVSDRAGTLG